jgi:aspartate ammonia-lyase
MKTRKESDLLGMVDVPAEALYGAQTERARLNFPNTGGHSRRLGDFPDLVRALLLCKKAAARVNRDIGALDPGVATAIEAAADLLAADVRTGDFPLHSLHGGGGTSANMNANEVLANAAEEHLGGKRGGYQRVHPNDHVNRHQSTNDVYPTACRLAVRMAWPRCRAGMERVIAALEERIRTIGATKRIARTCLQDALVITFGDYLGGMVALLHRQLGELDAAVAGLAKVSLGGSAVGRTEDVPPAYLEGIIPALREVSGDNRLERAANLFDAYQHLDDLVACSDQLARLARSLIKMGKDFRLLASGPETGFGEIELPAVQPGSSMMPGKINPVIPEFLIQSCFRVIGLSQSASMALDHGELDLNVWESTVITAILESFELLADSLESFAERCLPGLEPNHAQNLRNLGATIPRLTEMAKEEGYAAVSKREWSRRQQAKAQASDPPPA